MKTTKKQLLITLAAIIGILCIPFPSFAQTSASTPAAYTQVSPRKDQFEWRFKVENGKLYRRLYNGTAQQWVGEWEVVD